MIPLNYKKLFVRESNLLEKIDEDDWRHPTSANHLEALTYALDSRFEFSSKEIRDVHHILMQDMSEEKFKDEVGKWRTCEVEMNGGTIGASMESIPYLMQMWSDAVRSGMDSWYSHLQFESIHPFFDGNGRVGRILWTALREKRKLPFAFIPSDHRYYYHREISLWSGDNDGSFITNFETISQRKSIVRLAENAKQEGFTE